MPPAAAAFAPPTTSAESLPQASAAAAGTLSLPGRLSLIDGGLPSSTGWGPTGAGNRGRHRFADLSDRRARTSDSPRRRVPPLLEDYPASVRLVHEAVRSSESVAYADLVRRTALPPRTVRWAVRWLRERGLVRRYVSLRDGRQAWYALPPPSPVE